jgi:FKBP-type peptidyl-prolyl cis-trans isomerase FkpA
MAEVTQVPLQPVKKGAVAKLWLGLIVLLVAAAALAWATMPASARLETLTEGVGGHPTDGQYILINYKGMLTDGKVFDQGQGVPMQLGGTIPGFDWALRQTQQGGKYRIEIPADQAYGAEEKRNPQTGEVVIPANSDLVFEVDVLQFMSEADFQRFVEQQRALMQQQMEAMQAQQGQAGEAGAAPTEAVPETAPPQ